jgi:hypothetical protein
LLEFWGSLVSCYATCLCIWIGGCYAKPEGRIEFWHSDTTYSMVAVCYVFLFPTKSFSNTYLQFSVNLGDYYLPTTTHTDFSYFPPKIFCWTSNFAWMLCVDLLILYPSIFFYSTWNFPPQLAIYFPLLICWSICSGDRYRKYPITKASEIGQVGISSITKLNVGFTCMKERSFGYRFCYDIVGSVWSSCMSFITPICSFALFLCQRRI